MIPLLTWYERRPYRENVYGCINIFCCEQKRKYGNIYCRHHSASELSKDKHQDEVAALTSENDSATRVIQNLKRAQKEMEDTHKMIEEHPQAEKSRQFWLHDLP